MYFFNVLVKRDYSVAFSGIPANHPGFEVFVLSRVLLNDSSVYHFSDNFLIARIPREFTESRSFFEIFGIFPCKSGFRTGWGFDEGKK